MANSSDSLAVLVPAIQEKQLILPESTEGLTLADYVPVLQQYRDINATIVFDYRDKKGNAAARSHVAKLRKVKAPITDIHKRMKAEYLVITQKMDADKRDALAVVEEMIEYHDKELRIVAAEVEAEEERKKIEQEIADGWDLAHEMNAMFDRQRDLDRQAAEQARIAAEQAEEQRCIQVENEKREAAQKAAEEARLAEQARAAKVIEDAKQREQAVKEDAERRIKAADERARAEEERKRQEEARAAADLENIKRVHWAIVPVLMQHGMTEDQAKGLILAIRNGEVPAVSIDYQWQG